MVNDDFLDNLQLPCPVKTGSIVELQQADDEYTDLQPGDRGVVTGGNGSQIWVKWENGSTLSLLVNIDLYRIVETERSEP